MLVQGVGEVNVPIGEVKRTSTDDELVYQLIRKTPGTKREKVFLEIKTSLRSVERSLKRLKEAGRIEYRGSDKTGGWFIKTWSIAFWAEARWLWPMANLTERRE